MLLSFSSLSAGNSSRSFKLFFQQHQLQGTVTDGSLPLPGVTIVVKGKKNLGAISDYNGQYTLSVSPSDTLVVSFVGFKTLEVPVAKRRRVDIKMQYDSTTLQEVKVNAGYYSVKESERTGSISRITSKDIEIQPVTNVLAAMQGRMAGVSITQTTGVPGGSFEIQIRGQNSIRSEANAPLYIIDGVPYSSDPIGYSQTSTVLPALVSPLNSINPDTIESIEVLKDADATAIYGSRGANGVVLITTKRGKEGKVRFSISASSGAGRVTRFMKMMSTEQYLSMRQDAFINDKITAYPSSAYDINGTWDQSRYTNWQKELIGGTSMLTNLQGSLSGGSQYTQFLFSADYHTESTVFPGDFIYRKGGSQFSFNHQSQDSSFKMAFTAGYTSQNNNQPASDLSYDARTLPPNAPALFDKNGKLNWEKGTWTNPLAVLESKNRFNTKDLNANVVLSYEIIPDLTLKSSFGYTDLQHQEIRTVPSTIYNPSRGITSANSNIFLNDTERSSWITEPQLNWKEELFNGRLDVLLGATFQQQNTSQLYQSGSGFTSNSLIYNLASAANQRVLTDAETVYKYQAFFGRLNYNFKERYIANVTGRRDGSSRFGPGRQYAFFGAVGAAWLFSNENFFKNSSWLSFGKIRSSYGTTGSDQIGDYQFLDTYAPSGINYQGISGLQPTKLFNPYFGWEINRKLEVAIETGFFHDRVFFTAAWYKNRSSNQLVGIPLPGTTGFSQIQANLSAEVQNKGLEFTLRTVNFNNTDFKWISSLNISFSRNELISFPDLSGSTYQNRYRLGKPLNILLRYSYKGVNPSTGLYEFEDYNGDGKITSPDDRQRIVNLNPEYYGGFQSQVNFKNWKLDFLFQFVKQMNLNYASGLAGLMVNQPEKITDSWRNPGDQTAYQLYSAGYNSAAVSAQSFYSSSDATVTDASYIRLKNVSLTYDVPLKSKDLKCLFMLQGQNVVTFTSYLDGDPEFKSRGYLPPIRIFSAGIQLTF